MRLFLSLTLLITVSYCERGDPSGKISINKPLYLFSTKKNLPRITTITATLICLFLRRKLDHSSFWGTKINGNDLTHQNKIFNSVTCSWIILFILSMDISIYKPYYLSINGFLNNQILPGVASISFDWILLSQ